MKNIILCAICLASCLNDEDNGNDNKTPHINGSHRSEYKNFELDTECVRFFYMFWRNTIKNLTNIDILEKQYSNYNSPNLKQIQNVDVKDWNEINRFYTTHINKMYVRIDDFDRDKEWLKILKEELKNKSLADYIKEKNKNSNIKHVSQITNFNDLYYLSVEFTDYLYSHFKQGLEEYTKKQKQENIEIKKEHYKYACDICENLKNQLEKNKTKNNSIYMIELYNFFDQLSRLHFIFKDTEIRRGKDERGNLDNLSMLNI